MSLQSQIDENRQTIHAEGYSMSIGELISIYRDNELDIHPEFQRFFRWSDSQKSKLIESILLGIPIPPIFVAQRDDGVWDVIDGVQRLSTIFQFVGILIDQNGKKIDPLKLTAGEYLKDLAGKRWEGGSTNDSDFTGPQQLLFKREKLDLRILKKESDPNAKYELFQRLNSLGSRLSDQELRNCILIMINRDMYKWLRALSDRDTFQNVISLSERASEEQYDMELALRFVVLNDVGDDKLRKITEMSEFITNQMRRLAIDDMFDRVGVAKRFKSTFAYLNKYLGENAFRKYDVNKRTFSGPFLISAFEVIAVGLGANIESWQELESVEAKKKLIGCISKFWRESKLTKYYGSGVRASIRVPELVPYGKDLFSK